MSNLTAALQQAGESPDAMRTTSVVVMRDVRDLTGLIPAWEELAAHALEPNVFYEHWMLLPALEAYGGGDVAVVAVLADGNSARRGTDTLAGLFPVRLTPSFRNLSVSAMSLWRHPHCYLGTPLIRAERAVECVAGMLQWLRDRADVKLLELPWISADGPFRELLLEQSSELGLTSWIIETHTRGLWQQSVEAAAGARSAISGELRRRLRRNERRLAERGRLEHRVMGEGDDAGEWIEQFLRLEASGWKGASGTALACSDAGRRYFTQVATEAYARRRLLMLGLDYEGEPIARRCGFLAGDGSFAFKTAYDERFAGYSPGAMAELDSLTQFERLDGVRWMDSCTTPDNTLINRICNARRTIESLAIGSGALGELVISGLRLMRWTNRRVLGRLPYSPSSDVTS
ncbi:MAG TPA: GNAT family N-acetyltransferase [Steroidobacteraceae bacterium]|nr:GNAT family N-acetyltransferase [Steroidobacteraceae bacterium]